MIFSCIVSSARSGPAQEKEVTQVVTSAMCFHAGTLMIFQCPLERRSFCAPSRIDGKLERKKIFSGRVCFCDPGDIYRDTGKALKYLSPIKTENQTLTYSPLPCSFAFINHNLL